MTSDEQQWLEDVKEKDFLRQWEVERMCRLMGKNARKAVRDLYHGTITNRKYAYPIYEVMGWMGRN